MPTKSVNPDFKDMTLDQLRGAQKGIQLLIDAYYQDEESVAVLQKYWKKCSDAVVERMTTWNVSSVKRTGSDFTQTVKPKKFRVPKI